MEKAVLVPGSPEGAALGRKRSEQGQEEAGMRLGEGHGRQREQHEEDERAQRPFQKLL